MYYISTDATLTTANLHSALASLSDGEVKTILNVDHDSRERMIADYIMRYPMLTWEFLAGECFRDEKEKALEEVKKHFKRKSGA